MKTFEEAMASLGMTDQTQLTSLFSIFDADNSGRVDFQELAVGLSMLLRGSEAEWAEFEFSIFDTDKSGYLSRDQFTAYIQATSPGISPETVKEVASASFDRLDVDGSGTLEFDEFKQGILQSQLGTRERRSFTTQTCSLSSNPNSQTLNTHLTIARHTSLLESTSVDTSGLKRSERSVLELLGERKHVQAGEKVNGPGEISFLQSGKVMVMDAESGTEVPSLYHLS